MDFPPYVSASAISRRNLLMKINLVGWHISCCSEGWRDNYGCNPDGGERARKWQPKLHKAKMLKRQASWVMKWGTVRISIAGIVGIGSHVKAGLFPALLTSYYTRSSRQNRSLKRKAIYAGPAAAGSITYRDRVVLLPARVSVPKPLLSRYPARGVTRA